jgi:hypothetical protein
MNAALIANHRQLDSTSTIASILSSATSPRLGELLHGHVRAPRPHFSLYLVAHHTQSRHYCRGLRNGSESSNRSIASSIKGRGTGDNRYFSMMD